ncbi:MAG: hypothetical protein RLZ86_131 [Actinomycetota bacterium]
MSRRIDIELTSARPDGTWTWRAAGAREPKGVLDGALLPADAKAGDVVKVDAEFDIDGIEVTAVVSGRTRVNKIETLSLIGSDEPFQAVTQQLARRERSGSRGPRRGDSGDRRRRNDGDGRTREARDGERRERREGRPDRPRRPRFEAPPELPARPKPKRLKAGSQHRRAVLADIPENQRPIAELALQGMQAVRQRLKTANEALAAEGKPTMPEQSVVQMAQDLLPKLRVADWLDRAEAAKRDLDTLDLRDLRSVVAAANDPAIERDDSCRALSAELKAGLATRSEADYQLWLSDIDAALGVGRVVRALKLAGQPPKAGAIFPDDLGRRLADAAAASLTSDVLADRWIAVLEAAAFSPVRSTLAVTAPPSSVSPELTKTVERLAPLMPQIAAVFGVTVAAGAPTPKPLRPTKPVAKKVPPRIPPKPATADVPTAPAAETSASENPAPTTPVAESTETPAPDAPSAETPVADTTTTDTAAAEAAGTDIAD